MDYSTIVSLPMAEDACREGFLEKALLLPEELGGQDVAENRIFIPPPACVIKADSTVELIGAVRSGLSEVAIVPEYRGQSFVPSKIVIRAARTGLPPEYERDIEIW